FDSRHASRHAPGLLMRARVLGSSAGGGLPQWNCACRNCEAVRNGELGITARTQDSVLVGAGDGAAVLLNASPDLLVQFARAPELAPRALRHSPLAAVVLTSGDLDHVLGLLSLREDQPLSVYATAEVQVGLCERNVLFRRSALRFRLLEPGRTIELLAADGGRTGLELTPFALSGKLPRHLEGTRPSAAGDLVGLSLAAGRQRLVYASTAAALDGLAPEVDAANVVLFDGSFFSDDELPRLGIGTRTARDMAHLPVGGTDGSLANFPRCSARRIYTHVNNTNPMLRRDSPEAVAVARAGWEIAYDGMELFS
ncbi:MAG TPA: MBL fold metallo-hydrolase, partial [Polyangiaceae bacterium]